MLSKQAKTTLALFISFDLWLIFDILTKWWATSPHFQVTRILGDWFYLTNFQKNDGIAFSVEVPRFLQIGGSVLILIFLLYFGLKYLRESKQPTFFPAVLLGAVLAGGVGNLIERILQGYVVDFIVLGSIPVFNIADVGITLGLIVLFATMLLEESKNKKP